ncbi:MAG TPA: DUF29 domain-containing protein [Candidatus Tectomicrobia bacterium]|nr:DUF29 domain-containing protein [Candidatus Tectomicrobia bacterium]
MTPQDYEADLYAWTKAQAEALRAKDWAALDVANLAEEIESLGREQAHAVESYLALLCLHLLKWRYQPDRRGKSWRFSMRVARQRIARRLRQNPSLRPRVPDLLSDAYADARRLAADQTDLPLATFPEACPWSLAQVLDEDFLPEVR